MSINYIYLLSILIKFFFWYIKPFNKLTISRNNNNRLAFKKNYDNNKVNRFDINDKVVKYVKILEKSIS